MSGNNVIINNPRWFMVDETYAHNKEVIAALRQIQDEIAAMDKAITTTLPGGHRFTSAFGKGY